MASRGGGLGKREGGQGAQYTAARDFGRPGEGTGAVRYDTLEGKPEGAVERLEALAGGPRVPEEAGGAREPPCSIVSGGEVC